MKIIAAVTIEDVQRHLGSSNANVKIGSYGMDLFSPLDEFNCFRVTLNEADIDKLFLLNCGFVQNTTGHTGRVRDIDPNMLSVDSTNRVNSFLVPPTQSKKKQIDLRCSPNLSIVLVCANAGYGPWTIIDGNHRAIAHYLKYGGITNIKAYVCVHPQIINWPYVTILARYS